MGQVEKLGRYLLSPLETNSFEFVCRILLSKSITHEEKLKLDVVPRTDALSGQIHSFFYATAITNRKNCQPDGIEFFYNGYCKSLGFCA